MDSVEFAKAAASLPLTALLLLVLIGGYVEWWIYGSLHRSRVQELQKQLERADAELREWQARYFALIEARINKG